MSFSHDEFIDYRSRLISTLKDPSKVVRIPFHERVIKTFPLLQRETTIITLGELINSSMQDHALVLCWKKILMQEFPILWVRYIEWRNNINILHDNMH